MGDIVDIDEQKQAAKANFHSPVIVANILSLLQEKKAAKEYKPMFEMILVTNGKVDHFLASIILVVTDRDFRMADERIWMFYGVSCWEIGQRDCSRLQPSFLMLAVIYDPI